ncbi:hypothetical protein RI196_03730 [Aeribacillus composti]|uniref:Fur-regulated basic protein A n=1 Tax=Aeribacillus composti TaxID=1868734 RepID=A0ABY9WCF6_9BACI|nr:hypothetical protein [Aeribacillus composti]WNF33806.1 hypothetical protein RI196_03730 [Aeribacillus composti]
MIVCFTTSRLMKVSEVRRLCQELRENPALLMATELKAKEEVYKLLRQQEKTASAPTLAV